MALQNLINVGVTAVDVMMLGRVGEKVLSGSSLAGQIQFIMMLIFFGITSGATVLTAQYWGKKDIRTIEKILGMGLTISLAIAVIFMTLALTIPGPLMRIFTSDPEVIAEGVKYLRIVGISYLFIAVTQVYLNIMRSIERVMIATFVYFMSLVCQCNYECNFDFWTSWISGTWNTRSCNRHIMCQNDRDIDRAYLCTFHESGCENSSSIYDTD